MLMVELLARMPDLRRRIVRDHVSDPGGHCRDCHGARWPCEMYQLAIQADRLHAFHSAPSPWPPRQRRGGPVPPPPVRRDPVRPPAPWSGSRPYPPLGGPASWPAQRVPPAPAASYPTGWPADPPPARATPYPARAVPAWPTPPVNHPPSVPPPRSGAPEWQSWPSSWTPEVPPPRQDLGWDRNAPPRHSLGFPARERTHPPEPRRELSSVLEDVLRWSR